MTILQNIDYTIVVFLQDIFTRTGFLSKLVMYTANWGSFLLFAIGAFYFLQRKGKFYRRLEMLSFAILTALIARFVVKDFITLLIPRPRPFVEYGNIFAIIEPPMYELQQSFPSGHAIFMFSFAYILFVKNKRLGKWAFILSVLVGIARIASGVHYLTDVIFGALLGIATAYVCLVVYEKVVKLNLLGRHNHIHH